MNVMKNINIIWRNKRYSNKNKKQLQFQICKHSFNNLILSLEFKNSSNQESKKF